MPPPGASETVSVPWSFSARRPRFGRPRPPPSDSAAPASPTPLSVMIRRHDALVHRHPQRGSRRLGVPSDVGQRLPDGREQVLLDELVDRSVEWALERDVDLEPHDWGELVGEDCDVVTDAAAVVPHPELVNGRPHLRDHLVDLPDGAAELPGRRGWQAGGHALQGQTQGEEPLDHRVVQVASHPVPVLIDGRTSDPVMEAGVLDRDAGRQRQRADERLVVVGELRPADLVGQVEVAVHLVAHLDRHPEEGRHGRVVGREAEAVGMLADLVDAERLRSAMSSPRTPRPVGRWPMVVSSSSERPDRDEIGQGLLLLVEHAQRPVACPGHGACLLDDMAQDLGQLQVRLDQQRRLEHPAQLGRILNPAERHRSEPIPPPTGLLHVWPGQRPKWEDVAVALGVFLLDDHEVVRTGLRALLEASDDIEVVGEASTVADALARIPPTKPNVAILDVRLPDGSGVEVCREIRSSFPEIACVMLTSYADDEALMASIMAGAAGYVLKQVGSLDLLDTIRRAGAGQSLLDPALTERVLARLREGPAVDPRLATLTPQERRILDLIAEGYTNRQIAETMFLAEKTVKNYVSNLLAKLGMERRTQAATFAARLNERSTHDARTDATGT